MKIYNKYNVGQTYYRYRNGLIKEINITRLYCLITTQDHTYRYCGMYDGGNFMDIAENELLLFETKEECRKYAIAKLLEQ